MTDFDKVRAAALAYVLLRRRGMPVEEAERKAWASWFGATRT